MSKRAVLYAAMQPDHDDGAAAVDVEALCADAHAAGFRAGHAAAETALAPLAAQLAALLPALAAAQTVDAAALRAPFCALVTALAEAVLARELQLRPDSLAALVDAALAAIDCATGVTVATHADDRAAVAAHCPVAVVADERVARGNFRIDGPAFVVRDGLRDRLDTMLATL